MSARIVVAGASAGLGAALTVAHRERGDRVAAVARRPDRLELLAACSGPGTVRPLVLDLSKRTAAKQLVASLSGGGRVDRFYAVAASRAPTARRLRDREAYFRLCFLSWIEIFDQLRTEGLLDEGSTFVVVSSLAAVLPFKELCEYGAAKAALEAWARAMREDFRGRMVVVRPGQFDSEFFEKRDFSIKDLPHQRAGEILRDIDRGQLEIVRGGWRDCASSRLVSLIGARRTRRVFLRN